MRKLLIAAGGILVLAGAFLLGQYLRRDAPALVPALVQAPAPAASVARAPAPAPVPAAPPAPTPPPLPAATGSADPAPPTAEARPAAPLEAPRPAPTPPSFDHVRVSPRGDMVLAGRADPDSEVTILYGSQTLGVVRADLRGEWVFVPAQPVSGGGTHLSLRARARDGSVIDGNAPVLVLLPAPEPPPMQVATAPSSQPAPAAPAPQVLPAPQAQPAPAAPLVVELPREAGAVPRVLQAPPAAPMPEPPPVATLPAEPARVASLAPALVPVPSAPPTPAAPAPAAPAPAAPTPAATPAPPPAPTPAQAALPPAPGLATPPSRGPVSLQVVDYDERGEVRFAGTATPNAPVRVYVNNDPVGEATAGADGRWAVSPATPVAPGVHQLRVDQLMPSGQVAQRVEAPFQRVEIPPESLRDGQVVVQPGHNLWRIARSVYGRGVHHTVIYQANRDQIRNPNLIYPGQVFSLPTHN